MKLILHTPEFFATPPKRLAVEENAATGRTYILKGDKIVAVLPLPTEEGRRAQGQA